MNRTGDRTKKNIKPFVVFHIFFPKLGGWILSLCKSPLNGIHANDAMLIYISGEISFLYAGSLCTSVL